MIHAVRGRTELPVSVRPPAIGPPTSVDPATAVRRERDDVPGDMGGETPQGTPAFSAPTISRAGGGHSARTIPTRSDEDHGAGVAGDRGPWRPHQPGRCLVRRGNRQDQEARDQPHPGASHVLSLLSSIQLVPIAHRLARCAATRPANATTPPRNPSGTLPTSHR